MTPFQQHGTILTEQGWIKGSIRFDQRILAVEGEPLNAPEPGDTLILPGFIDLHVHGGGGRDIMDGGDAVDTVARLHAQHGTTSLLATTMTAPQNDLDTALHGIAEAVAQRQPGRSRVLGVHLEGPYINPGKLGAQPDFVQTATLEAIQRMQAIAPLRLITVAPEMEGNLALVCLLAETGIRIQIGHTLGSYEDGLAALEAGASGFAHLFNAMSPFHHRAPGMAGAALAHANFAELIPDLLHVHPGAIRTALRAIPQLYCVTDSTAATGMPDGAYMLGRQQVHKCLGGVRLADGTLAGSTLTMDQALRNLVGLGLTLADASRRVSTNAADFLGLSDRGRLRHNAYADLLLLDPDLQLTAVYVEGEPIDLGHA